jgi:hypothetical protein
MNTVFNFDWSLLPGYVVAATFMGSHYLSCWCCEMVAVHRLHQQPSKPVCVQASFLGQFVPWILVKDLNPKRIHSARLLVETSRKKIPSHNINNGCVHLALKVCITKKSIMIFSALMGAKNVM